MRNAFFCVALVLCFASSIGWAAPMGPGGRIYYTTLDNDTSCTNLFEINVDADWDALPGEHWKLLELTNDTSHYTRLDIGSPEILHPRANADGTASGGDGSVFQAHYYASESYCRYTKVLPDGSGGATTSSIHPGQMVPPTGGSKGGAYVVDVAGRAGGVPSSIICACASDGSAVWHDVNADDDLYDDCDTYYYPGSTLGGNNWADAEVGGSPGDSSDPDTIWGMHHTYVTCTGYTGDYTNTHTWAAYNYFYREDEHSTDGIHWYLDYGSIAVGDTDNDGKTDVYTWSRTGNDVTSPSIVRMADLNGTGNIDPGQGGAGDLARVLYDDDTLTGDGNNMSAGGGELELVRHPATGKWTLLILDRGTNSADGRILVFELADNGDFGGSLDSFKVVLDGIPSGSFQTLRQGIEFDADPAAIPEPATVLLVATGLLSVSGCVRRCRRRMGEDIPEGS